MPATTALRQLIIMVDDEPNHVEAYLAGLRQHLPATETRLFTSAQTMLDFMNRSSDVLRVAAIVLDIMMKPDPYTSEETMCGTETGLRLYQDLRKATALSRVPIVFLTNRTTLKREWANNLNADPRCVGVHEKILTTPMKLAGIISRLIAD